MAEQVVKMRGGLANIESLGAGGLGGGGGTVKVGKILV